jgi:hypothetical protein
MYHHFHIMCELRTYRYMLIVNHDPKLQNSHRFEELDMALCLQRSPRLQTWTIVSHQLQYTQLLVLATYSNFDGNTPTHPLSSCFLMGVSLLSFEGMLGVLAIAKTSYQRVTQEQWTALPYQVEVCMHQIERVELHCITPAPPAKRMLLHFCWIIGHWYNFLTHTHRYSVVTAI